MSGWGIGKESRTWSWVIDWWNVEREAVYDISWLTLAVRPWCGTCVHWNLLQFRNERSFLQDQHYISRCRPRYLHAVNVNEWRADYTIFPLITERSVKVERSAPEKPAVEASAGEQSSWPAACGCEPGRSTEQTSAGRRASYTGCFISQFTEVKWMNTMLL